MAQGHVVQQSVPHVVLQHNLNLRQHCKATKPKLVRSLCPHHVHDELHCVVPGIAYDGEGLLAHSLDKDGDSLVGRQRDVLDDSTATGTAALLIISHHAHRLHFADNLRNLLLHAMHLLNKQFILPCGATAVVQNLLVRLLECVELLHEREKDVLSALHCLPTLTDEAFAFGGLL